MSELNSESAQFPVVGMGASAGGLAALQTFFDHAPADTGVAYVVVMHLSPEHQSHLPELLQSHTKMPVTQVTQPTMEIMPDHVYVIPPNRNLATIDTHLRLSELEESPQRRAPIDHFFRTLAGTHGEQAIGIVLSGTGSDGSVGLKQIKGEGGLTIAQDPVEAEYDSMPQSAIGTGLIDLVLPVAEMPQQIRDYVRLEPRLQQTATAEDLPETNESVLQKIFTQLHHSTGHDFSGYKRSTVMRRIRRRMQLQQIEELSAYLQHLRQNQPEIQILFQDLLITVTNFFRDEAAFAALGEEVVHHLFADKGKEDVVRVWIVGCATGEEAYSLAMLLLEHRSRLAEAPELQVFATDISKQALARAREGYYPAVIGVDVSPERLKRFFDEENGGYRVNKQLRDTVLFAEHNLLSDPPFSRQDLITCRNLLIYLQREVQNKVMELFHYALKPGGFLFLGSSESLDSMGMFRAVDKKQGIYRRRAESASQPNLPSLPLARRPLTRAPQTDTARAKEPAGQDSYGALHQEMVERYAPPSLLVSGDFNIVHLSQRAGRYLHQPGGEPTNSILQRILPELRAELTTALYGAFKKERPSYTRPVRLLLAGEWRQVSMSVYPAALPELDGYVLISFVETEVVAAPVVTAEGGDQTPALVQHLEAELAHTKERLQTAVEEFETSKEEMQASNEELQSMNEELHSTAEELETSKEELQSINEELLTVSQEHKTKAEEMSQLSSDLQNLLVATGVATLFLDREPRIRRFTPQIGELFNLMEVDRGRPLSHITHKLHGDHLLQDAGKVLETLAPIERQMTSKEGRHYLVRLRPYRSVEDRIDGVVITFVDVTRMKGTEAELRSTSEFQRHIVDTVHEGLLVLTFDLRVKFANQSFYEIFQVLPEETVGTLVYELGNGQWDIPQLRTLLEEILPDDQVFEDYEVRHVFERIGERAMRLNGRRLSRQQKILLAIEDVTDYQQAMAQLKHLNLTLEEKVAQRTHKIRELASELLVTEQNVRQRIAQSLHDDLQQVIYSMRMQLGLITRKLQMGGEEELAAQMAELDTMMETAFIMTRQIARELKPPIPVGKQLSESLAQLAAYVKELHELDVDIVIHDEVSLPDENMRYLLFHIVRELLFNVVKHAEVDTATLEVNREPGELKVSVIDSGKGFEPAALRAESKRTTFGLYSIRERLNLIDGRLEIHSIVGDGSRIDIHIPLDAS